jgi:alpha-L-fucosidase
MLNLNRGLFMKKYFNDDRDRFFENRLGLFIHWGIYAVGAWHEQHGYRANVPRDEYARYADMFNPRDFNPVKWLDMTEDMGADYLCFTSKHIDGFCMFDTKYTDFNVMNTPYGKDILKELSDECHKRNFPIAIYYSPLDRNCPLYPYCGNSYENPSFYPEDTPDMDKYIEHIKNHVRELCTNYGKLYAFWWDGGGQIGYHDESVNELVRELQPGILINNRGFSEGDFRTPERDWYEYVNNDMSFEVPTEACQSIGTESWGYRIDEDYYSTRYIMESMDKILAKGGNYLLNAGPMANGCFHEDAKDILSKIGNWYKRIRESFDGTQPFLCGLENKDVLLTKKDDNIFVHLYKFPKSHVVWLKPLDEKPKRAILLNDGSLLDTRLEITPSLFKEQKPYLRIIGVPVHRFSNEVMVIKLEY